MEIIEGEYQVVTFTPDSWHSFCGINLTLMPGILLNGISIWAIKSPLDNPRYVIWMTDHYTSKISMPISVC